MATTQTPPGMSFGPFSNMLTAPTYSDQNLPQNRVSGFTGPAGQVANVLDQFMKGASLGRFQQFQQNELQKSKQNDYLNHVMATVSRPGFDQAVAGPIIQKALAMQTADLRGGKPDPSTPHGAVHNILKGAFDGILGPSAKKTEPLDANTMIEWKNAMENPDNFRSGPQQLPASKDFKPPSSSTSAAPPQLAGPPIPQQPASPPAMPSVVAPPVVQRPDPLGASGRPAMGPPATVAASAPPPGADAAAVPPPALAPTQYDPASTGAQSAPPPGAPAPRQTREMYLDRLVKSPEYAENLRYGIDQMNDPRVKAQMAMLPTGMISPEQQATIEHTQAQVRLADAQAGMYKNWNRTPPVNMVVTTPDGKSSTHSVYSMPGTDGNPRYLDTNTNQPLLVPPGATTSLEKASAPGTPKTIATSGGFYQVGRNGAVRALTNEGGEALMPQVKMVPKTDQNGRLMMVNPVSGESMQATDEDGSPIKMTSELQKIITREGYIDNRFWQRTDTQLAVALGKTRQQQAQLTASLKNIKNPALRAATQGQVNDLMEQERGQLEAYRAATKDNTPARRGAAKPTASAPPPNAGTAAAPAMSGSAYAAFVNQGGAQPPPSSAAPPAGGRGGRQATGGSGKINVTAPDGSVHPFDTQAQADNFKKIAGIR